MFTTTTTLDNHHHQCSIEAAACGLWLRAADRCERILNLPSYILFNSFSQMIGLLSQYLKELPVDQILDCYLIYPRP
jgi:hypothetical protein